MHFVDGMDFEAFNLSGAIKSGGAGSDVVLSPGTTSQTRSGSTSHR